MHSAPFAPLVTSADNTIQLLGLKKPAQHVKSLHSTTPIAVVATKLCIAHIVQITFPLPQRPYLRLSNRTKRLKQTHCRVVPLTADRQLTATMRPFPIVVSSPLPNGCPSWGTKQTPPSRLYSNPLRCQTQKRFRMDRA